MKCFLFSSALLALASAAPAAVPCDAQADVAARVALALAQAPVTPQAPAVIPSEHVQTQCYCDRGPIYCACGPGACKCDDGKPCLANKPAEPILGPTKAPHYTFLVISKSGCVPCEKLRVELMAKWGEAYGDHPGWDIWKDSPGTEAVYGGVMAYPTILLLRRRDGEKVGREIGRHVGYMSTAEMQRWLDHPDAPQSRGESVPKGGSDVGNMGAPVNGGNNRSNWPGAFSATRQLGTVPYTPQYQPMMRYSAACRGSS